MQLYTFELLLAVLLFTAIPVSSQVEGSPEQTCFRWRGDFRNCMCGQMRRDSEVHCHDDKTYYQPILSQDLRACPFRCENGGIFNHQKKRCDCPEGFFGLCCNTGKQKCTLSIRLDLAISHLKSKTYARERHVQFQNSLYVLEPNEMNVVTHVKLESKLMYIRSSTESRYGICGEVLLKAEGVIRSIGFPSPYPSDQRCVWKIITDPERRIALSVKDNAFDIEQGSDYRSCSHDKLDIFDSENRDGLKIGSFCGKGMRKLETVYSTQNHLYIEFVSETSDKNQTKEGFELHYTTFLEGMSMQYQLIVGI